MKNDLQAIRQRFVETVGTNESVGYVDVDGDDARWLIDTFIALANEVERLRLDVGSARSRADHAESRLADVKRATSL